jgi:hypothetical protein
VAQCRHPPSKRETDLETGFEYCRKCNEQLPPSTIRLTPQEIHGREPTNLAVFRANAPNNSKLNGAQLGPQPHHLEILNRAIYGKQASRKNDAILPTQRITRTCPSCGVQQPLPVFGENIVCVNPECGIELGHFVFRYQPYNPEDQKGNGESNYSLRFWADLRAIQSWDPVEDDETIRLARQVFGEMVKPLKLSPEDAHFLAREYLKGVKAVSQTYKRDLRDLLTGLLTMKGIIAK